MVMELNSVALRINFMERLTGANSKPPLVKMHNQLEILSSILYQVLRNENKLYYNLESRKVYDNQFNSFNFPSLHGTNLHTLS